MRRLALLLLCAAIVAPASLAAESAEIAIREANARLKWILLSGNADAITTEFYAPGAVLLPPDMPVVTGEENIKALWNGLASLGSVALDVKPDSIEVKGDTAIEVGRWRLTIGIAGAAEPVKDAGKYIVIWKLQEGGAWRATYDIWNSDSRPLAAPK